MRERPGLIEEAGHRIANHLAIVAGMVNAQIYALRTGPEMLDREAAAQILEDAANRILGVARLHRRLMEEPDAATTELGDLLIETMRDFASALSLGERLSIRHRLDSGCVFGAERAQTLSLIVGEIMLNAAKHAHPTGVPIEMSIACSSQADGSIALEICDDGIGLPEGFDSARDGGLGFRLIRSLSDSIGATLHIESDELGLCFHLLLDARHEIDCWMEPPGSQAIEVDVRP